MPNKKQDMTATKGNMAAQQKGARPDYPDIDGDGNKTESMKKAAQDNNSNAAQQRGKVNLMKQKAKVKASKNKSAASKKKGSPKPTSSISKASLILNPNKKVFKNIEAKNDYDYKLEKEIPMPSMAAPMKGDYAAKMSDTDMGIKERYGKQATSDVLAAQQKGNPIMPNFNKKEYTDSGMNYRDANNASIDGGTVDEENLSNIKTKSPYRPYVETTQTSKVPMRPNSAALPGGGEPGEKLYLDKAAKMHAKHPSMKRMSDMVTKVATYNMPNVKAAQKKYHK